MNVKLPPGGLDPKTAQPQRLIARGWVTQMVDVSGLLPQTDRRLTYAEAYVTKYR